MATINSINSNIPIEVTKGGTGLATLTAHSVQVGNGTSATTQLGVGTNGQVLVAATTADPAFATLASSAGSITYTTGANTLNLDIANYVANSSWTPVLTFGGGSTGITYSVQTGSYSRLGKTITFAMRITLTSDGSSTGAAVITGLPVAPAVLTPVTVVYQNLTYAAGIPATFANTNSTILLDLQTSATTISSLTNTNFANTTDVIISGSYLSA